MSETVRLANKVFSKLKLSYRLNPAKAAPGFDMEESFVKIYEKCAPYTLTGVERMYSLYKTVEYIVTNKIPGDIVECGVWKGGSCMMVAETLKLFGDVGRRIYLYDTFEGMSEATEEDVDAASGEKAADIMKRTKKGEEKFNFWAYAPLDAVKANLESTGYPSHLFTYVKGKVEDSIPGTMPGPISILRLDTDWYESTKHEMVHLYPLIVDKGVLIIDDYGHFKGARKAIDEYFEANNLKPLLHRVDYTCRSMIKHL